VNDHGGFHQRRRFDDLYQANYLAIFRYLYRRLPSGSRPNDAADLTAEVFVTAWRRIDKVPDSPDDRFWLYGVARRTLQHHRRGHLRRERLNARLYAEAGTNRPKADDPTFDAERIQNAIASLKSSDREVFCLIVWDELDNQSAARILGCSVNTVTVRLHRARARLRAQLAEVGIVEPKMTDEMPGMTKESRPWM
jgi:RNA polymerase sigma-70 factor (ECF subfamily)